MRWENTAVYLESGPGWVPWREGEVSWCSNKAGGQFPLGPSCLVWANGTVCCCHRGGLAVPLPRGLLFFLNAALSVVSPAAANPPRCFRKCPANTHRSTTTAILLSVLALKGIPLNTGLELFIDRFYVLIQ